MRGGTGPGLSGPCRAPGTGTRDAPPSAAPLGAGGEAGSVGPGLRRLWEGPRGQHLVSSPRLLQVWLLLSATGPGPASPLPSPSRLSHRACTPLPATPGASQPQPLHLLFLSVGQPSSRVSHDWPLLPMQEASLPRTCFPELPAFPICCDTCCLLCMGPTALVSCLL